MQSYNKDCLKILDFGCGDGAFIKCLINDGIEAAYYGTDISQTMINLAKQNISNSMVEFFIADGFNLPIKPEQKFDLIHLDSVLHHIIGNTKSKSNRLVNELLEMLFNRLDKNGSLIVEELYYDSYIFRELTSFLIFYGLKFFNFTHIDISKFLKEYSMGLEVNFFSNRDLINILKAYGEPHLIKCKPAKVPTLYKLFFLKKLGNISYVIGK
jgi:SAM-dependent methyltransferase